MCFQTAPVTAWCVMQMEPVICVLLVTLMTIVECARAVPPTVMSVSGSPVRARPGVILTTTVLIYTSMTVPQVAAMSALRDVMTMPAAGIALMMSLCAVPVTAPVHTEP